MDFCGLFGQKVYLENKTVFQKSKFRVAECRNQNSFGRVNFYLVSVILFISKIQAKYNFLRVLLTFLLFSLDAALLNLNLTEIGTGNNNRTPRHFQSEINIF